jgi:hypothetical protein
MLISEIRKLNGKGIQEHSALKHPVVFVLWLLSVLLILLTKLERIAFASTHTET